MGEPGTLKGFGAGTLGKFHLKGWLQDQGATPKKSQVLTTAEMGIGVGGRREATSPGSGGRETWVWEGELGRPCLRALGTVSTPFLVPGCPDVLLCQQPVE